jgi:beta-galactosidase
MKIGTYYYPEQWPREQWTRDFDRIASMGLQIVHMAEFAWFSLEPEPGKFKFDWLDECLEMCRQRELEVILCTPTAAPPIWLSQQHPDILPVDQHGTRERHGGRRHYSPTSKSLHEATRRIVTAMADHFGGHQSVIGWQIDNEYSGAFDQSDQTHREFQDWLRSKYKTIDELNQKWGNQFWNQYYTDFSQILMPPDRNPRYANPHHHLDASRFWSSAWAQFNKLQADILKPKIGDRFITTNFMPFHLDCDPGEMSEDLTLYAWDAYPVTGWEKNIVDETYRMADPADLGFIHDQMASYTGRWAQLELQPGQVNWSGVPVLLYPGAVRLWLWTAFAHGAEFVTTYRFRQSRFGIELFHHGLMNPDGVTPSPGGRQFVQVVEEMRRVQGSGFRIQKRKSVISSLNPEPRTVNPSVGLLFDFDQLWYFNTLAQARKWDQPAWIKRWYAAIARLALPVKVLHPDRAWPDHLPMIVVPAVQMVDEKLVARLNEYVKAGGHLVLTCRTALMDKTGQLWEGPAAAPIVPLIGGNVEAYDGLPDDTWGQVELDGAKYKWNVWGDLLYSEPNTKVLAKYADQFYASAAAVIQNKHGKGLVTYCGVYAESALVNALMEKLARQSKLDVTVLPARVHLLERDGYKVLLNYQDKPVEAPAPRAAKFVIGSRRVEPAGVAIWKADEGA